MCMSIHLHVCICSNVSGVHGDQKVPMELQMVVSTHVGSGDQIWVLCKSSKCSLMAEPLLRPLLLISLTGLLRMLRD